MNTKESRFRFIVATIALIVAIMLGLFTYGLSLRANLSEISIKTLEDISKQQQFAVSTKIKEDILISKSYALLFSDLMDEEEIVTTLKSLTSVSNFDVMSFISIDGDGVSDKGARFKVEDTTYLKKLKSGKTFFAPAFQLHSRESKMLGVLTPIKKHGNIIGVLSCNYALDSLGDLLYPFFDGKGYTYLTDSEGTILTKTIYKGGLNVGENIFDAYNNAEVYRGDDLGKIKENFALKKTGDALFNYENEKILLHYMPVSGSDWFVISVVPNSVVSYQAGRIMENTGVIIIFICFAIILIFVLSWQNEKRHTLEIAKLAYVDALTGKANFNKFKKDAKKLLKLKDQAYTMIMVDIERFKLINSIYGYDVGNQVIKEISKAIDGNMKSKKDIFARVNADKFVMLIQRDNDKKSDEEWGDFETIAKEYIAPWVEFKINMPEGRYSIPKGENDILEIYEKVNFAHTMAKQSFERICYYDENTRKAAVFRKEIENRMEKALEDGEFKVFLQPKYGVLEEKLVGAEALVRWIPKIGDMIYPDDFIYLFEENGFVIKLDMYMLEETCKILNKYMKEERNLIPISVNFSKLHLGHKNFAENVRKIVDKWEIPHKYVELELTETMMAEELTSLTNMMNKLRELGFTQSIDDFGMGYSSLGMLKDLPVDVIKLDKSFFTDISDLNKGRAVLESIILMAEKLNIKTVAEGIETKEHVDLLKEIRCQVVQGYYFAKPMSVEDFEKTIYTDI